MRIYNRRDFYAGIMFVLIGAFFGIYAQDYSLGTANRMGPGYFPTLLAGIMLFLGVAVLVMAFLPKEAPRPPGSNGLARNWLGAFQCCGLRPFAAGCRLFDRHLLPRVRIGSGKP